MQKWEYCEVDAVEDDNVHVKFYRSTGSIVQGPYKFRNYRDAREKAKQIVAQLGLEGWELVNVRDNGIEFWLKRPIE